MKRVIRFNKHYGCEKLKEKLTGNPNYLLHVHHNWITTYTSYAHVGRTKKKEEKKNTHMCGKEDKCKNIL